MSEATEKSSLAESLNEIYQANIQIYRKFLSSFQHSSKPLSQGEAEGRVSRGKPSVGDGVLRNSAGTGKEGGLKER